MSADVRVNEARGDHLTKDEFEQSNISRLLARRRDVAERRYGEGIGRPMAEVGLIRAYRLH